MDERELNLSEGNVASSRGASSPIRLSPAKAGTEAEAEHIGMRPDTRSEEGLRFDTCLARTAAEAGTR